MSGIVHSQQKTIHNSKHDPYNIIMKGILISILLLACCSWQTNAVAKNPYKQLQTQIEKILDKANHNVNVGVIVVSLDNKQIIYQKNSQRFFVPASTIKLFTAVTALQYLGPDYQFNTTISARNKTIKKGVLQSNLYFRFSGDPSLSRDDLLIMLSKLRALGIKAIKGNVYIDDKIYDQEQYGPGWMWDELHLCYASPIHAIKMNDNCVQMKLIPAKKAGQKVKIINLHDQSIAIKNDLVTGSSKQSNCRFHVVSDFRNQYHFIGCIRNNRKPFALNFAVRNIRLYMQKTLKSQFRKAKIKVTGKFDFATSRRGKVLLVTHSSDKLSELVTDMLKDSDNDIADALYKVIAFKYFAKPATWSLGAKAMKKILTEDANINMDNATIVDGSGLSRYNLVSPMQMLELLYFVYKSPDIKPILFQALPISGTDGSLQYRMGTEHTKGKIYAKTGTMSGVSSLAGFIETKNHKILAFAIMFNNFPGSARKYEKVENQICSVLAEY